MGSFESVSYYRENIGSMEYGGLGRGKGFLIPDWFVCDVDKILFVKQQFKE